MVQNVVGFRARRKGSSGGGGVKLAMNEFIFLAIALLATALIIYIAVRYGGSLGTVADGFF